MSPFFDGEYDRPAPLWPVFLTCLVVVLAVMIPLVVIVSAIRDDREDWAHEVCASHDGLQNWTDPRGGKTIAVCKDGQVFLR